MIDETVSAFHNLKSSCYIPVTLITPPCKMIVDSGSSL